MHCEYKSIYEYFNASMKVNGDENLHVFSYGLTCRRYTNTDVNVLKM